MDGGITLAKDPTGINAWAGFIPFLILSQPNNRYNKIEVGKNPRT